MEWIKTGFKRVVPDFLAFFGVERWLECMSCELEIGFFISQKIEKCCGLGQETLVLCLQCRDSLRSDPQRFVEVWNSSADSATRGSPGTMMCALAFMCHQRPKELQKQKAKTLKTCFIPQPFGFLKEAQTKSVCPKESLYLVLSGFTMSSIFSKCQLDCRGPAANWGVAGVFGSDHWGFVPSFSFST